MSLHLCKSLDMSYTYTRYTYFLRNCIHGAKRGYYGFIIVVVVVRVVVRVRRDFLLATYSPHFFPDFFHIWQVA